MPYGYGSANRGSTNQGPAGGASAGGNYGGNRNPQQTYGRRSTPVTTAKGPPSILSRPTPTVTTAKGPPSILSRPTPPVKTGGSNIKTGILKALASQFLPHKQLKNLQKLSALYGLYKNKKKSIGGINPIGFDTQYEDPWSNPDLTYDEATGQFTDTSGNVVNTNTLGATQVGLNKEQIDFLNAIDTQNKAVGYSGLSTTHKSERNPEWTAGAFFENTSPTDVWGSIQSLNPKSRSLGLTGLNFDPDKIVSGDTSTYAQPDEVTSYIQSLSPEDKTYSWGLRKNEPDANYTELARGGRASYFDGGLLSLWPR